MNATRPEPFPVSPDTIARMRPAGTDEVRTVRWLLSEAWRRLRQGRKMEKERALVFPECSVIARDIERLTRRLNSLTHPPEAIDTGEIHKLMEDL